MIDQNGTFALIIPIVNAPSSGAQAQQEVQDVGGGEVDCLGKRRGQ